MFRLSAGRVVARVVAGPLLLMALTFAIRVAPNITRYASSIDAAALKREIDR